MLARNENALLAALRSHRHCKRLVRTIDSLPKVPGDKLLDRYYADAPALYVVPGRFVIRDDALIPYFTIAGVIRNVAGNSQARKGDGIDLGLDHLMSLVVRALHGHRIGDCNWDITQGETVDEALFEKAGIAAVEMTLQGGPIELDPDWEMSELDDLLRVHADIDIEPHSGADEHAKWLKAPPDFSTSTPDATLDVQLNGAPT